MPKNIRRTIALLFTLIILMCVDFVHIRVTTGKNFQLDSETLVTGVIRAQEEGDYKNVYGLGRYINISKAMFDYEEDYLVNDVEIVDGYISKDNEFIVNRNEYTEYLVENAHVISFLDEQECVIDSSRMTENYIYFKVSFHENFEKNTNISLRNARYYDKFGNELNNFLVVPYTSQFGLQGKIFGTIAEIINYHDWKNIEILISIFLTSLIFVLICFFVKIKYNNILALCFYFVFLLSPWTANFSSNLYWVEFTWFAPMLLGLIASLYSKRKKDLKIYMVLSMLLILIKSLCGYEYLSTIMMALVMFPMCDLIIALTKKDWEKFKERLVLVLALGVFSLIGFFCAIMIHSYIRGEGELLTGLKNIWSADVLRRTIGGNKTDYPEVLWSSFDASITDVLKMYFNFNTDIIRKVPSYMFKPLCLISLVLAILNLIRKKNLSREIAILYLFSLIATCSWFVLAKSHSYIHTHMNYVLWYFGFVQICFYTIVSEVLNLPFFSKYFDQLRSLAVKKVGKE